MRNCVVIYKIDKNFKLLMKMEKKKKKTNLKYHFYKKFKKLSKVHMMLCNQSIQKLINMKIYQ